jgi:hypothetical protein
MSTESVPSSILHTEGHHTVTLTIVHEQVSGEVLNKEEAVMLESLTVQSVKHSMSSTISSTGTAVSLATLSKLEGLATKSTLVNLAILGTRERQTVALQLTHCLRSLTTHVVNGILVT